MYFASLKGGRWNLPKSHGVLYCSENPLLSCLEVAYHDLMEGLPHLRRLKAIQDRISTSINVHIPDDLRFLIVVLVFDLAEDRDAWVLDETLQTVKATCNQAGFRNYTGSPGFDEDFLLGNDYSVTQTIGAVLYGQKRNLMMVRSARLAQPMKLVLPNDHAFEPGASPLRLKPLYYEFDCRVEPLAPTRCYVLEIKARGRSEELDITMHLDRVPLRPSVKSSAVRTYLPSNTRSPEKDGRSVVIQKYHLPSLCPHRARTPE
jgi:hypothetical protein